MGSFIIVEIKLSCMMATLDNEDRRTLMSRIDSSTAKLVFHSLALEGAGTAAQLQERLDLPQLTILSVLRTLSSRGLVDSESRDGQRQYFPAV